MADNYFDSYAQISLEKVTPVVNILFDEDVDFDSRRKIIEVSQESVEGGFQWRDIAERVFDYLAAMHLLSDDEVDLDPEEHLPTWLQRLATFLDADPGAIESYLESTDFDTERTIEMHELCELLSILDDGHGFAGHLFVESAWHCNRIRLGQFGGSVEYYSPHLTLIDSSQRFSTITSGMNKALAAGDIALAAESVSKDANRILDSMPDPTWCQQLLVELENRLGAKRNTPAP